MFKLKSSLIINTEVGHSVVFQTGIKFDCLGIGPVQHQSIQIIFPLTGE